MSGRRPDPDAGGWCPGSVGPEYVLSLSKSPPRVAGKPTLPESILLGIFRRYPSRTTIFREYDDQATVEYESEREWPFWRFFGRGPEMFAGRDVLDLGCGWGGRPVRWLEVGATSICGVDVSQSQLAAARALASEVGMKDRTRFVTGVGEQIPCEDASFDLVVMNDVMEHVADPERVVAECYRVLRPGGRLAAVFPPYYDVFGGSHLHGYATSVPGLNLLFPTRVLKRATLRLFAEQGVDHRPFVRDAPTDKLWNMNGLTIRGFKKILARSPFEVEQLLLRGHFDRRFAIGVPASSRLRALLRPLVFLASDLITRTPLLQEIFCSRVCVVLRKPD